MQTKFGVALAGNATESFLLRFEGRISLNRFVCFSYSKHTFIHTMRYILYDVAHTLYSSLEQKMFEYIFKITYLVVEP